MALNARTPFGVRLFLGFLPMGLTPLWGYLIAESYLNFGAGEKDLFLLVPWVVWSLYYLAFFVVLWVKQCSLGKSLAYSIGGACLLFMLTGLLLYLFANNLLGLKRG